MKEGDRVKVRRLVQGTNRGEIEEKEERGKVVAVVEAAKLYPLAPTYKPSAIKKHGDDLPKTKFPEGTKIVQVLIDGRNNARNYLETEVTPVV